MARKSLAGMRRRLRCDATAPGLARNEVRQVTRGRAWCENAVLVASELVTNAVRHSGCDEQDEIELLIDDMPDGVVITVRDIGRAPSEPSVRALDLAPGGLGLRLVETLCTRWGTGRVEGRLVWAHVAC